MNEIKIVSANKEHIFHAPATFDEMTREQFILTAQQIINAATDIEADNYYLAMTGIEKKSWNKLHFFQRYSIKRLFDFISVPEMSKQLLPYIVIDATRDTRQVTEIYPNTQSHGSRFTKKGTLATNPDFLTPLGKSLYLQTNTL
jgi:hypothetical protein